MKIFCVLMLVGLAAGCASSKGAQLRVQVAADFKCAEPEIATRAVWMYVERATGCGRDNVYLWEFGAKRWVSPLDRATFELSCAKEAMRVTVLSDRSVGVEGCGQKAVYQLLVSQVQPPTWVLNSSNARDAR